MQFGWHFSGSIRWLLALGLGLALACGGQPSPDTGPNAVKTPPPVPTVQRLDAVVLLDPSLGAPNAVRAHASALLALIGDHLASRFGLELNVVSYGPWTDVPSDLRRGHDALVSSTAGTNADLIIGFAHTPARRRAKIADMVAARYLSRAIAVGPRSFGPTGRRRQPPSADAHALLQGVGTLFGALPACGHTVMGREHAPNHTKTVSWGPTNARLVRLHAPLDFRRASKAGLPPDLAQRVSRLLGIPGTDLACDRNGQVTRRRRVMVQLLAPRIRAAAEAKGASGEGLSAGVAALEADDPATALAHCGPLAEHTPAGPATLCAAQAAERSDRSEDAIRFYRALLAHDPDHAGALLALARLVGRDGDDAAARALPARCVTAHPDSIDARLNLGVALARLGDLQGARATWSALLERDPKHEEAKTLLRQLEAFR